MIETKTQNLDPSKTKLSGAHNYPQFKTKIPVGIFNVVKQVEAVG